MWFRFIQSLCVILSLICLSGVSWAQEIPTPAPSHDLKKVPNEYIIEATQFVEYCRNDRDMPLYFDCRCLGVKYLDKRIEKPNASASVIRSYLGDSCKDASGIAGMKYEQCLYDFASAPKHLDPEEYCSCFASKFALYFEDFPGFMTPRAEISLGSRARLRCSNPEAANKLYGVGTP